MSDCRNEIISSGAALWPRSCPTCKFGPCQKGIPDVNPSDKYAAIVKGTYTTPGYYAGDPNDTVTYHYLKEFESLDKLKEYILRDREATSFSNIVKIIKYQDLKYSTKVEVDVR